MKTKRLLLPLILASIAVFSATGCSNKQKAGGASTIQIKSYKGGYGTDWLHEMADKFKTIHPEISFEFVEESALVTNEKVQGEIALPKKNQIDLYFVTGLDVDALLQKSYSALKKRDVVLLEPLDDVFQSKAIGLDGKEESTTIQSRFFDGFEELCKYNGSFPKWRNNMFFLPWADASTGLFVNKSVLDKYNVEIPLTSNELINAVQTIYTNGKSQGNYPFSWAGNNAYGYWEYLYETWFAQYSGAEAFNRFMNCDPGNGKIVEEGYKVFQDQGILKALEAMFDICDLKYSPNGSTSKTHMEAQTEFVTGKTAFMCDGDWLLNEMKRDYFDQSKEIMMIGAPILSSIGTEIGITDAELHTLVENIDVHKSNSEIKTVFPSLTDANIERVRSARSLHDTLGIGHTVAIPSYADAKDAAKLFLRFMYSNDGCRIFRNYAYSNLPLSYVSDASDSNTTFQKSLDRVRDYERPQIITSTAPFNGVRSIAFIYLFNYSSWVHPYTFMNIMIDKASSNPSFTNKGPQYLFEYEQEYVKGQWSQYMTYINYL